MTETEAPSGRSALERLDPVARPGRGSRRERRIARWTRPRPRRDVRWAIGRFGQVLIAVGLLMFGFVGYQLWGTGIEYARAQDRADDSVATLMAAAEQRAAAGDSRPAGTSPASTPGPSVVTGRVLDTLAPRTDVTATATAAIDRSAAPATFDWSQVIVPEQHFATLSIPRLDRSDQIVEDVTREALQKGPGHFPSTPLPGQLGNTAVAGHRTTYGAPFYDIDDLEAGDEVVVDTPYGGPGNGPGHFVYRVTGSEVVGPNDIDVIATTDPGVATLTLVTCDPVRTARNRLIVYATLDLTVSDAPGAPVILDALAPVELPADDASTSVVASAVNAGSAPTPSLAPSVPAGTDPVGASTPSDVPSPRASVTADTQADAFSGGWFEDRAAWPHVAGWAALAAAVVVAGCRLAKAAHHGLVGLAVAAAPFVVALYFTYQNINRLLPAAL